MFVCFVRCSEMGVYPFFLRLTVHKKSCFLLGEKSMYIRGHYQHTFDVVNHSSHLAKQYSMGKNTHEKSELHKWLVENAETLNAFNFSSWEEAIRFVISFTDHL
jgi:hypothetical protein